MMHDASEVGRSVAALRSEYAGMSLNESDVDADPIAQFAIWMENAIAAEVAEANAMTVATATRDGVPSARIVLLKGFDARGFVFFTNYESHKGRELTENPVAALVFHWLTLHRQVRVSGTVERVSHEESETYFHSRPRGSQMGAWASHQSSVLPNRAALETRLAELEAEYREGEIPLPSFWGGFRVIPQTIEFWQGRRSRLHDRIRYSRQPDGSWRIERLSP